MSPDSLKVVTVSSLSDRAIADLSRTQLSKIADRACPLLYPLTLNLPQTLEFPGQVIYQACRKISELRRRIQQLGYATGVGCFWLPIALTAKGPLYAEVIGLVHQDSRRLIKQVPQDLSQLQYHQPIHLSDQWRQLLYEPGYR